MKISVLHLFLGLVFSSLCLSCSFENKELQDKIEDGLYYNQDPDSPICTYLMKVNGKEVNFLLIRDTIILINGVLNDKNNLITLSSDATIKFDGSSWISDHGLHGISKFSFDNIIEIYHPQELPGCNWVINPELGDRYLFAFDFVPINPKGGIYNNYRIRDGRCEEYVKSTYQKIDLDGIPMYLSNASQSVLNIGGKTEKGLDKVHLIGCEFFSDGVLKIVELFLLSNRYETGQLDCEVYTEI